MRQQISPSLRVLSLQALIRMASDGTLTVPPAAATGWTAALDYTASATPSPTETSAKAEQAPARRTARTTALKMLAEPCCGRRTLSATGLAAVAGVAASALPTRATAADNALSEILARFDDPSPRQWSAGMVDAVASSFSKEDRLVFPPWMEGEWEVTSRPLATAAPLGRRFLPSDLASMRLGDLRSVEVSPLTYKVRFARRGGDGAIVSDRCNNLKAVQDASAGYARVDAVRFEDGSRLKVSYSPFGRNTCSPSREICELAAASLAAGGRADVCICGGDSLHGFAGNTVTGPTTRRCTALSSAHRLPSSRHSASALPHAQPEQRGRHPLAGGAESSGRGARL